jgi:class 3 adenylate cyclase
MILFTDIVSFSRLMATGPLEETVSSLNDYFAPGKNLAAR